MSKPTLSICWAQGFLLYLCLAPLSSLAGGTNRVSINDSIPKVSARSGIDTVKNLFAEKPLIRWNGGVINYNFFYRQNIDTPYSQKDWMQHTLTGNLNFFVAGKFPVTLTYLARNSNSIFFKDIYDVRAEFNATAFRDKLNNNLRNLLINTLDSYKDSLTEKLYFSKLAELKQIEDWVRGPFTLQKVYEMNEIARMPSLTYNKNLPDSIARRKSDSMQLMAKIFLEEYERRKEQYHHLSAKVDSLKRSYNMAMNEVKALEEIINGKRPGFAQFRQLKSRIKEATGRSMVIPREYEWLMGIRKFSAGRSPVNFSELTAKNISVNGINFEYNSWYYFAATAGLIDYRFRDFSIQALKRPQYMYMVRLGLGHLERNYFIVSFFNGRKQLYTSERASKAIPVTGLSIETKYQLAKSIYIIAEGAQSVSPDFNFNPPADKKFFDLSDLSNKAFSAKLYSYFAKTNTRLEGLYKYTGANYQSFSSFQTNAAFVAWHLRIDQQMWKRQLRISASLLSNEFSNPYLIQTYKTNSIFKSIQLSFRKRKWPTVRLGYLPVSQFTRLDNQILESRFHTLNANLSHVYSLGTKQTATTVVVSKFYNSMQDSAFVYFNALNFVLSQNFFFKSFNASLSYTETRNPDYLLNVLDGSVQIPVSQKANISIGAKVNNLDKTMLKLGYYGSAQIRFRGQDVFYVSFEKGYLTGTGNQLTSNDFVTVSFSKHF